MRQNYKLMFDNGTSLMPTASPTKTWLKLIFLLPRQMRPQRVTPPWLFASLATHWNRLSAQ